MSDLQTRIVIETQCEHGEFGSHWIFDPVESWHDRGIKCSGAERRVTNPDYEAAHAFVLNHLVDDNMTAMAFAVGTVNAALGTDTEVKRPGWMTDDAPQFAEDECGITEDTE